MSGYRVAARLLLLSALLAGCATSTPPARDPYTGPDRVGELNPRMLLGKWQGRILNPLAGEADAFEADYGADGTLTVRTRDTRSGMNLVFEAVGRWSIEGDRLRQQVESVREVSGNALGGMMARFGSSMRGNGSSTANVVEANAQRVVLVSDDGGQAQELMRRR